MLFSELLSYAKKAKLDYTYTLPSHLEGKEEEITFSKAWTDSRQVGENDLFICMRGEKSDGHAHVQKALENKASVIIAEKGKLENIDIPVLFVEDSAAALMKIAHARRMKFTGTVIGITGTAGKTTVKEILAQILSTKGKTAKNYLNFNTQIGLPLSILNADGNESFWVLEAGISHEHDMDELGSILTPDIALVLNADIGHAEGLPKGAAYYKSKLFKYLKDTSSTALACADYPALVDESLKNCKDTLFFTSQNKDIAYKAEYKGLIHYDEMESKGLYSLKLDNKIFDVQAPLRSAYGAENVLAIAMIASLCGMSTEEIQEAFAQATLPSQRFEVHHYNGITLIDDSYNANPLSFARMLEAACEYTYSHSSHTKKPFICIAGAMGELGEHAEEAHKKLGEQLAQTQAEMIFYTGNFVKEIQEGLTKASYKKNFILLSQPQEFTKQIQDLKLAEAVFLVKGSRSNHLEVYVQEIKKLFGSEHAL